MSSHPKRRRKELGSYYTPESLSEILADWAVRTPNDSILEPSFGGCGFLESTIAALEKLGSSEPASNLYGADIDPEAFQFLSQKLGKLANLEKKFLLQDFLALKPHNFSCEKFDAAIGNPPYVSLHNMSAQQRETCNEVLKNCKFSEQLVGRKASLWCFFLLHALEFLNERARSAWVLPSSFLHANYARGLLEIYKKYFEKIKIIKLNQRFFQSSGADEISVVVLTDNYTSKAHGNCSVEYAVAKNLAELKSEVHGFGTIRCEKPVVKSYKNLIVDADVYESFLSMSLSSRTSQLHEIATVSIGMVTGDNNTFVIDRKRAESYQIEKTCLKYVVRKFSDLIGLKHTKFRHQELLKSGARGLLVCPDNLNSKGTNVRSYLSEVSRKTRRQNKTFKKRVRWYYPDDERIPSAFLSYMTDLGPRLVINEAAINCTNSIHRVFLNKEFEPRELVGLAVSSLSSLSQLSAELRRLQLLRR